jgi:hypothetical protein
MPQEATDADPRSRTHRPNAAKPTWRAAETLMRALSTG